MVGDILAEDTATQTGVYSVRPMVEIQLQKRVQIDYWVCAWVPSPYLLSGCETLWSGHEQCHCIILRPDCAVFASSGYETNIQKQVEMHEIQPLQPLQIHVR